MIILETERLILRDFVKEDIAKRIEWETLDTEWHEWDGPWEYENLTPEEQEKNLQSHIEGLQRFADMISRKSEEDMRYSFQLIEKATGEYIGWISCYCIDEDYNYTGEDGLYAFGIDIPPQSRRGKGYGYEAFKAVLDYLVSHGLTEIYTQTWSGNTRMTALARKLGFQEAGRKIGYRSFRGKQYDAITYKYEILI